jgi:hypothetical protein
MLNHESLWTRPPWTISDYCSAAFTKTQRETKKLELLLIRARFWLCTSTMQLCPYISLPCMCPLSRIAWPIHFVPSCMCLCKAHISSHILLQLRDLLLQNMERLASRVFGGTCHVMLTMPRNGIVTTRWTCLEPSAAVNISNLFFCGPLYYIHSSSTMQKFNVVGISQRPWISISFTVSRIQKFDRNTRSI